MNSVQYVSSGAGAAALVADGRRQAVSVSDDERAPSRYDSVQIALHWATAILVVALYSLSQVWGFFAKATTNGLVEVHISLGVLLAGVVLARIFWRFSFGRRLPAAETGLMGLAAKLGHLALYLLLIAVVGLGFACTGRRPDR
jgi:cytochrome b561